MHTVRFVGVSDLQYVSSPGQKPSRSLRRTVWPTVFLGTYSKRELIGIYSKLTPEITRRGIAEKDFTVTTEIPHWQGYSQTKTLAESNTHIPITIRIQRRPPHPSWYSNDLAKQLDSLHICTCIRGHTHAEVARGRRDNGDWVRLSGSSSLPQRNE